MYINTDEGRGVGEAALPIALAIMVIIILFVY